MKKLKIGVIGVGSISGAHIGGYLKNPNVELYALCDIDEEKLKLKGEKYGVTRLFTNADDMLALEELDAVSVCTWNKAHKECAIKALKAKKHVLCEKPMAMNKAEAEEMKKVAEDAGKLLMIGFVRRHGNDTKVLKEFIDNGDLGDIYYAKTKYVRRNGCPGGWFGNKELSGGGPLIDLGVHTIDLIKYLMGNPKPVSVYAATFDKLGKRPNKLVTDGYVSETKGEEIFNVEDLALATIRFDNGAVLTVETSFSLNTKKDDSGVEIYGTKGGASFTPDLEIYNNINGYMTNISFEGKTAFELNTVFCNEINHFVDCILNGTECIATADDGIALMAILDAAYESARTGHEVVLA